MPFAEVDSPERKITLSSYIGREILSLKPLKIVSGEKFARISRTFVLAKLNFRLAFWDSGVRKSKWVENHLGNEIKLNVQNETVNDDVIIQVRVKVGFASVSFYFTDKAYGQKYSRGIFVRGIVTIIVIIIIEVG